MGVMTEKKEGNGWVPALSPKNKSTPTTPTATSSISSLSKATRGTLHYTATIHTEDNKYYQVEYVEDIEFGDIYPKNYTLPEVFPAPVVTISMDYQETPAPRVEDNTPGDLTPEQVVTCQQLLTEAAGRINTHP